MSREPHNGKRKPPTRNADRVADLMTQGVAQIDIAAELGITRQRVQQIVARLGIGFERKQCIMHKAALLKFEKAHREQCKGMTAKQTARHMDMPLSTVTMYAKQTGVKFAKAPAAVGEKTRRLQEEGAGLAAAGYSKAEAARELGYTTTTQFFRAAKRYLPDVRWRDGRKCR